MELYSMLNSIISIVPFLMMYRFVYRNWFRFDVRIATFLFVMLYILEYVYLSRIEISGINRAWIHVLLYAVPLTFFRKEMVTKAMIIDVFFNFLYNVIGTIIMLLLVKGYDILTGTDNQTWMAMDYNTRVDYLFRYLMMPTAGGISCYIAYKVMPLLEKLTKRERLWIALGLAGTTEGFIVFNRLAIKGIDDYYGGIVVICYGLALLLMGSICIFCVLLRLYESVRSAKKCNIRWNCSAINMKRSAAAGRCAGNCATTW